MKRQSLRGEAAEMLRRIYKLSAADQLLIYTALREYLGSDLAPESLVDVAVRQRAERLSGSSWNFDGGHCAVCD